ncbi:MULTISPECIES: hypothetical protein [Pseudomonas syringae group]|uniref:hypothetical protein n=1 Tax=Pseudomonas syringae group TaxID=136849 RepID=UPI0003F51BC4|nr:MULTISPECIES: hypothetical protein [Pseudomonas syringae group]KPW36955.1 Uncharacterized protein ALO66_03937 [Pseudomonas coronafaciens pv. atropurpurea]KPZ25834.1 hypothetical protein ALO38_100819 [Pseudomonas coronafaciens pv. zizaniae]MCF5747950.1 hypothetical protein [Pseudomonas tremae]MCF5802834.1 hypothetical protein [Pseudomonas tremae]MCF5811364.1 hypothetical protein [Pseudomonas tremae]
MSQEAKVIALEHLVLTLLEDMKVRSGSHPEALVERAISSIRSSSYPGDEERMQAAVGALKDLWTLVGAKKP